MKVLITGAHFTTAVAVIEELKKHSDVEVIYVGRKTTREGDSTPSIESQILPKMGVKFIPIKTGRLQRSFSPYTIPSLSKIPIGLIQALSVVSRERPDVVLGLGGYVAVPVLTASWLMSVPVIVHEQTLVSGLANTLSSRFARKVAVSFESEYSYNKKKVVLTGNPIRSEFLNPGKNISGEFRKIFDTAKKQKLPVIFLTGGNQGSHVINESVEYCLRELLKIACVIHQTGDSKFKDFERLEGKQNGRYLVKKFIEGEMAYCLANADLVVSRAGINTLTELAYLGTPALVIPVPYLYKDEQNQNAKFFENLGLVRILPQSKLSGETLLESIQSCLNNLSQFSKEAKKAKQVIIPDAAHKLASEVILLSKAE